MNRLQGFTVASLVLAGAIFFFKAEQCRGETKLPELPNFVVIFVDDMGYNDIGPFGAEGIETPHLDQMAANGMKFTDFQVSSAVCSASRAALLTGCYHTRVSVHGAYMPARKAGLHPDEMTLAELCKQKNYATACFGKWHLGHHPPLMPNAQGFDEYFGLPYSNDMWPYQPKSADPKSKIHSFDFPSLPLYENNTVVNADVKAEDQARLTTQYTERAVDFIERNSDKPFLLYIPHSMVHVPLYVSDKFKGKSERGLYGDVVMEIDWSVGQITEALKKNGVADNTLVVFTSDNGPWLNYGDHAGLAHPLREGKGTMFEGGCRVPTIMQWPGVIPPGSTCDQLVSSIDIFPTIANRIGATLPDHPIDGVDILSVLKDPKAKIDRKYFFHYYGGGQLHAVRDQRWKLHFAHQYRTLGGRKGGENGLPVNYDYIKCEPALYDLDNDIGETVNLIEAHPDIVARLKKAADVCRAELGDKHLGLKGEGVRPAGKVE
ncbi:sulfatase family protein [Mariniblastus fucicola]|uniref:Arylsulfatase n=1 Tax=Mariniblastus fucicola TaxID=980251 RepID=A0A5B9P8V2_9BACT|nr:sulfatase [Mariniblastus fucicola]QEG22728.1 Arylsulfatase [Mariniblastus fucicola]